MPLNAQGIQSIAGRFAACLLALLSISSTPVAAQESRAALISSDQAEKAMQLRPYEPSKAERYFTRARGG